MSLIITEPALVIQSHGFVPMAEMCRETAES